MLRYFRCFLCFLVICCLLINLYPLKAEATSAGIFATFASAGAVTVSAPVAIAAGLIALGIMVGTNDDFQRVVDNAVSSLGDWIKDGTVELLQTIDSAGKKAYYMASDAFESLRSWAFAESVVSQFISSVSYSITYTNNKFWSGSATLSSSRPFNVICFWRTGYDYYAGYGVYAYCNYDGQGFDVDVNGNVKRGSHIGNYYVADLGIASNGSACASCEPSGSFQVVRDNSGKTTMRPVLESYFGSYVSPVYTSNDLTLGYVPIVPVDGSSARQWSEEYTDRGLYVVEGSGGGSPPEGDDNNNNGKWYWPVVLAGAAGAGIAGVAALTQQDQWTGETPQEFDEYSTKTEYEIVSQPDVEFGTGIELQPVVDPAPDTGGDSGDNTGLLEVIWKSIIELPSKFGTWFDTIISEIQELPSKFAEWFGNISTDLERILESICNLPEAIGNVLRSIFVPSEDFLTEKVKSLRSRFNWIEPILGYGEYIKAQFVDPVPPVIYVHLGDAEGSYNYGGTVKFLDMSWYERYKPYGDTIISGFLWALFAWRMYLKLPGIINGAAGDVGQISYGESAWQKAAERKARKGKKE